MKAARNTTATHGVKALARRAAERFAALVGRAPKWCAAAPGRVNLIGEHVDYNDGLVLPMAIDRHVVIAAAKSGDGASRWYSTATQQWVDVDTSQSLTRGEPTWANYIKGVLAGYIARQPALANTLRGLTAVIDADLPLGGGLSSSAALEVAAATLVEAVSGDALDPVERGLLCQRAEHEFARVPCGIMDQFTSALARAGCLLLLDCRSQQARHVPLRDDSLAVLIVNTNVRHELTDGAYAERRRQCEQAARVLGVASLRDATMAQLRPAESTMDPTVYRRARHVVSEIDRTQRAADAIERGDWNEVGRLMAASHVSLRDDYEVSCPELDLVVELADSLGDGVIGCRMTGGGFGGCAVALVRRDSIDDVSNHIAEQYRQRTGIDASLFVTQPAQGARMLAISTRP